MLFEAIKTPCHGQCFHGPLVEGTGVDTLRKLKDIFVWPFAYPLLNNFFYRCSSSAFDGSHAKADFSLAIDRKPTFGLIDIRSEYLKSHSPAFFHKEGHLGDVIHVVTQYRGHVFSGIMGFEVGSLVRDPCVAGGV